MRIKLLLGVIATIAFAPFASAEEWADIEGRIQYAYYTNDARALNLVLTALKPKVAAEGEQVAEEPQEAARRAYYRALAHYRIAQVLAPSAKGKSRDAAGDCGDAIEEADEALPKPRFDLDDPPAIRTQRTEIWTLETACTLAGREGAALAFIGGRIGDRWEEAIKLEPKNPRVRLIEALVIWDKAGKKEQAQRDLALKKLKEVTLMFEAARRGAAQLPEWGAAEAYAWLGRALLDRGDAVGAREAIERSLLIAPDYAFARTLLSRITR
jgi:tetratricopeptide (TPR) repeat protein